MKKKGVSPVIATILLVAIVVILAAIIFLWARGFIAEELVKNERAISTSCESVVFRFGILEGSSAECSGELIFDFANDGDIPIFGFVVKKISTGEITITSKVEEGTLRIGDTMSTCNPQGTLNSGENLQAIPIILGESDSGKGEHTCEDNYGVTAQVP
jgi:flagellin-like protein